MIYSVQVFYWSFLFVWGFLFELFKLLVLFLLASLYDKVFFLFFIKLGFIPCDADQPLQGIELKEKETQKD